ncbi:Lrp/AsnC family transcriptional regulator [Bermanella sp. R86510]|uniref:Lrp/AsnC family transcriptional regulator n=1 Tax=unclassified Bermanella TaxID=2627862 RepID=UPI0037CAB962
MIKEKDSELLALLQQNARASISELARALNLSRSTVQSRIERLEHIGVIKGYRVDYGEEYLQQLVSAHVSIKVKQKLTPKTTQALYKIDSVVALHAISGEYDLIAIVQAQNLERLNRLLDDIGGLEGVERTASSVILETKFRR